MIAQDPKNVLFVRINTENEQQSEKMMKLLLSNAVKIDGATELYSSSYDNCFECELKFDDETSLLKFANDTRNRYPGKIDVLRHFII